MGRPLQPRQGRPYHVLGNLLSVLLPDDTLIEYITDGKNRRVAKLVNGTPVRKWLYQDDLNPVAELDGDGNLLYTYAYASQGHSPDYAAAADGTVYPIAADHLGSPVLVVNISDDTDVLLEAEYSAFGAQTLIRGDARALSVGFAGGVYDVDTGLVRFGARDYDPVVGRWTAKDPTSWRGRQANLFAYAFVDPVNAFDASGLDVYLCHRVADLPLNSFFGVEHHFLLTDSQAAGLGACGGGVPGHGGVDSPYVTDACINDHSSKNMSSAESGGLQCDLVTDVDEACVDANLSIGSEVGKWTPWNPPVPITGETAASSNCTQLPS